MNYSLVYSKTTRAQVRSLHPLIKSRIKEKIELLKRNPYAGKYLQRELSVYCSLRVKRYRIIYKVKESDRKIEIHFIGPRKDIYELFKEKLENDPIWPDGVQESADKWGDFPTAEELRNSQGTDTEREPM